MTYMQLNKVISPVHYLETCAPCQNMLARAGKDMAMCPMYTLVLEELERQHREQSDYFVEENQCLSDVIIEQQGMELGGDRHDAE